jgi:hypothetical protein
MSFTFVLVLTFFNVFLQEKNMHFLNLSHNIVYSYGLNMILYTKYEYTFSRAVFQVTFLVW